MTATRKKQPRPASTYRAARREAAKAKARASGVKLHDIWRAIPLIRHRGGAARMAHPA